MFGKKAVKPVNTVDSDAVPWFRCPVCWRKSYHPEDIKNGYCGYCHDFTRKKIEEVN